MPIMDIVTLCPESKSTLAEYGLHCFHCAGSEYETLEDGCKTHGFGDEEIDDLVSDLNDMILSLPDRPQVLTVTLPAAEALQKVAAEEGHAGEGLVVTTDSQGGFCMEFRAEPLPSEKIFSHPDAPSMRLFASDLTLRRIGGSTIDFRDGRFKLDLPEDSAKAGCGCGGSCSCNGKKGDKRDKGS